jgi:hypothetical protein
MIEMAGLDALSTAIRQSSFQHQLEIKLYLNLFVIAGLTRNLSVAAWIASLRSQ